MKVLASVFFITRLCVGPDLHPKLFSNPFKIRKDIRKVRALACH
jgi:hypothetical protein